MMQTIIRKLKSRKGESLIESMAAILIFTMASIVLYSMVTTAGSINGKAKTKDQEIQAHLVAVESGRPEWRNAQTAGMEANPISGSINVVIDEDGSPNFSVDIDIYGGQEGSLFAYFVHVPGAGGGGT